MIKITAIVTMKKNIQPKIIEKMEMKTESTFTNAHLNMSSKKTFASYPWAKERAHNLR